MTADWRSLRLGEVSEIDAGGTPARSRPDYWNGPIPWMSSGEIHQRRVVATTETITDAGLANSNAKVFPPGTVMMALNGQGQTRGRVAILEVSTACNQSLAGLRVRRDLVEPRYLFHALSNAYEALRNLTGTGRSGLNLALLRGYRLPVPPIEHQRVIAATLDAIDVAIEHGKTVIAVTESLRRSLLEELLTRGMPNVHQEWHIFPGLGRVPQCWVPLKLGDVYEIDLGKMVSPKTRHGENRRPYLTNRNVHWGSLDLRDVPRMHFDQDELQRYRLRPGDLLVCEGGEVGRAAIWRDELTECYYQKALHRLRPRVDGQHPPFLRFLLEHASRVGFLRGNAPRTSIPHLTRETLADMRLPFPSTAEQAAIAGAIEAVEVRIAASGHEVDSLGRLYSTLADALLNRRLVATTAAARAESLV